MVKHPQTTTIEPSQDMFMEEVVTWLKRATGIGYVTYDPLVGGEIDVDDAAMRLRRVDRLVRDVERLERELRRIGLPV